jgi:hypothetical protein
MVELNSTRRTFSKNEPLFKYTGSHGDWETYFLRSPHFPISSGALPHVQHSVQAVLNLAQTELQLRPSVFLQSNHFRLSGAHRVLQQNARLWKPELGVAAWPERGGIRPWTREQFENLEPGAMPEPMLNLVFHLTGDEAAARQAINVLLGTGTLLVMFSAFDGQELLRRTNSVLGDLARHPSMPPFEFVVPLLGPTNVEATDGATLEEWSCGADLYFRESTEDGGLFLLARKSVSQLLPRIGVGSVEKL